MNSSFLYERLKYLSFFAYANDSFILNQWKDVTSIKCEEFSRCLSTGADVLDYLHINAVSNIYYGSIRFNSFFKQTKTKDDLVFKLIMQAFLAFGWRLLTFMVLLIKSYER